MGTHLAPKSQARLAKLSAQVWKRHSLALAFRCIITAQFGAIG